MTNKPAMVMRFDWLTSIMWFRAIDWVSRAFGFSTRGRIPHHADNTSPRLTIDNHMSITQQHALTSSQASEFQKRGYII